MGSTPTNEEVATILEDLRSTKQQCPSSTMLGLTNYLMRNTVEACVDGGWHWFCNTPQTPLPTDDMIIDLDPLEPATLITEVATFTLTYHAYNASAPVRKWKGHLSSLLGRCTGCVEGYDKAKLAVEDQFLSHHPSQTLRNFFLTVTKWEAEEIAVLGSRPQVQPPQPNLSRLPPSLIHLLLLSPSLTQLPSMHDMFERASKSTFNASDAESHLDSRFATVGEGLLELLLQQPQPNDLPSDDEDPPSDSGPPPYLSIRKLARLLLPPIKSIPLSGLAKTLPTIERLLAIISSSSSDTGASVGEAWEVLSLVLERLDNDALNTGLVGRFDGAGQDALERGHRWLDDACGGRTRWTRTVGIVAGHLGEDADYFPSIFSSFLTLLDASGRGLWSSSSSPNSPTPPNPIVVLDNIKNNQRFLSLFETGERRCFEWFDVFVQSLTPLSEESSRKDVVEEDSFQEGLKRTINFLAEGVQHSRFDMSVGVKAMTEVFKIISHASKTTSSEPSSSPRRRAIHSVFEIYSSTIASVAFASKDHRDPAWSPLRPSAKKIFSLAFDEDASTIRSGAVALASLLKPQKEPSELVIPSFDVRDSLWKSAYDGMGMKRSDIDGLALLIRAVARFAHVEVLSSTDGAWSTANISEPLRRRGARTAIGHLNESLVKTRSQFASAIERFGNVNNQDILLKLWNAPLVTSSTLSLLLSPDEDIHEAIQALIQQSFSDVDDRADCFRVLLQTMPDQAMEGLITFLSTFVQSAVVFPEACSMAKWMVRCLTDVIDVLCRPPRGLLLDDVFVNHQGIRRLVPKLWRLMTESISLVFSSTMHWAVFYPNDVMVDWMRDALIFARLMVDMTRTFETAAVGGGATSFYSIFNSQYSAPRSPTKMSTVGKGMVESLNNVLGDLLSWLRLTDVETLHQTFELIKMILDRFHRSNMEPKPSYIARLQNFVNRASGHRCKLTDGQLAEISDMLAWWEDDEVVEIVQPVRSKSSLASSSSSRSGTSSKEVEKAAWAKVLGSSSPAPQKSSKSSATSGSKSSSSIAQKSWRGPGVADSSRATDSEKDEYDDEFPEFSDFDLAAMDASSSSSSSKSKPQTNSSSRLGSSLPPKSQTIQLGPKYTLASKLGKTSLPAPPKMGTIAGLRAAVPATKSSSSSKGGALNQLRSDFKSERKAVPKSKQLLQPKGMMKAGFSLSISNKSEIQPSPKKRRTDTQDSDSTATDSSDDEDEVRGLAAFSQAVHQKPPVAARVMPPPTRTIKFMADEIAIKSPAEKRREAKELARRTLLRLKPDLESLHRMILQWDPKDTNSLPPDFSADSLQKIPPQFESADQYLRILEPLLMLECWAQVQKAVEDSRNEARITCELAGRMNVDDWIDIEFSIAPAEIKQGYYLNDVDVVQIYPSGPSTGKPLFAKVVKYKKTFKDIQLNLRFHNSRDLRPFISRSKWVLQKVVNLSTMHREYGGLHGMPYYDRMLPSILRSDSFPLVEPSSRALDEAMSAYAVNRPQAKAILGAMNTNTSGFVLIQGPPGTGKTKTICGLVGKFLSDRVEPATRIRPGGQFRPEDVQPSLKILVCAPSNAAIDEVTKRLRDGIRSSSGKTITPKIVRIGNDSSINIAVKDVSLDELVDQKLRGSSVLASADGAADMARIRSEVDAAQSSRIVAEKKLQDVYSNGGDLSATAGLEEEIKKYKTKRARLMQELNKAKDAQKDSSRSLDAARRKARQDVVFEADIICCTLSGAGHDLLGSFNFETVIIDEAAQAVELSALIPLKYQCRRCIMVGDPNQLPPTVMSQVAERYNYSESMFVRIQRKSPQNVHLLSIQYRMHPDISVLPSRVFYNGELEDGPDMATKTAQVWHSSNAFSPYRFFNVNSSREMSGSHGHSLKNEVEVDVALSLYKSLKDQFPRVDFDYRIGIVTMYKEQKMALIRRFQQNFGYDIVSRIDFNTVDGFQGQEKDIIILSCVRAGPPGSNAGVGFLKDSRRMNVALTRARSSLFIIGHAPTLEGGGPQWKGIVNDARARNALVDYHHNVFQPSRQGPIAVIPTEPKAIQAPPPLPPGPSTAPPPLPPMQTPKEMSAARKEAKKERKEIKRRASSPSTNGNGDGVSSKESGDLQSKRKKIKRSKEEKKADGKGWVEKMKEVESDSDTDPPLPPPAEPSTLNPPQKRKLVEVAATQPPPAPPSTSNLRNGSLSSSSSDPAAAPPPPPPPAPALSVSKPPPFPKPPPRPKAPPNLFMPSKRKPVRPQGGNASSSTGAGPAAGGSARAMLQAQALTGLPSQPPLRK